MTKILTLNDYLKPLKVPDKLLAGRLKPDVPSYSRILREWYEEQYNYVLNGITINGKYWNPFIYHFLNFFYFPVQRRNPKTGLTYVLDEPNYALFSRVDEYVFDKMWEAVNTGQHIVLMGSRGIGKSYWALSLIQRKYNFFPNTHAVISASIQEHVDTAWGYMDQCMIHFNKKHPALRHKTVVDNTHMKRSGEIVKTDDGDEFRGYDSKIEKILYGKNPNKTRSKRPNIQLIEEFGAFPSKGLGNLKEVLAQSRGSNIVGGGIMKNFVIMMGTGGSVSNDHAKEVFHKPASYGFMKVDEWEGRTTGLLIPVQYKMAGTWEETGVPDVKKALELQEIEREKIKETNDPIAYNNYCQEFPQNLKEIFLKKGTNRFNQNKIASQINTIEDINSNIPRAMRGSFKYNRDINTDRITGVRFVHDGIGPINMIEEVEPKVEGKAYENLYVIGLDSIDMGISDSVNPNVGSKLAALVKKRIIDGRLYDKGLKQNMYVCWYNERSMEVDDDYEQIMMMALYFRAKINIEYTRINIISYFRERHLHHMFMPRPSIALGGDGIKKSNLVGTQVNDTLIDHQDYKIKSYVNDYCEQIYILPLLEQLRDYQREDRTPWDLVVAMGLCELADEEFIGKGAKLEQTAVTKGMKKFGYYTDKDGYKRKGTIPESKIIPLVNPAVTWIDEIGTPMLEEQYLDSLKMEVEYSY